MSAPEDFFQEAQRFLRPNPNVQLNPQDSALYDIAGGLTQLAAQMKSISQKLDVILENTR